MRRCTHGRRPPRCEIELPVPPPIVTGIGTDAPNPVDSPERLSPQHHNLAAPLRAQVLSVPAASSTTPFTVDSRRRETSRRATSRAARGPLAPKHTTPPDVVASHACRPPAARGLEPSVPAAATMRTAIAPPTEAVAAAVPRCCRPARAATVHQPRAREAGAGRDGGRRADSCRPNGHGRGRRGAVGKLATIVDATAEHRAAGDRRR